MARFHHIKPDPYRPPAMDEVRRACSMHAEGFTVSRILAATSMSLGAFDDGRAPSGILPQFESVTP